MAYSATPTVTALNTGHYLVDINETDVGVADSTTVSGLPKVGSVMRVSSSIVSGAGTTVAPVLSTSTTFTGSDVILEATAAATVDEVQTDGVPYVLTDGKFYHQATPDAGSNNVIQTRYLVRDRWSI
jgi:isoaspartyl peptidase/L-asparaginase-like protein (Ntn-hydrolase superfamily)